MSTDELSSIELSELQVWEQWPKTHPAGRVCDHDGCATILSKFNAGATCEMHKPAPDWYIRNGLCFAECPECGSFRKVTNRNRGVHLCPSCASMANTPVPEQQRLQRARDRSRARYWANPEGERERQRKYRQGLVPAALLEEVT